MFDRVLLTSAFAAVLLVIGATVQSSGARSEKNTPSTTVATASEKQTANVTVVTTQQLWQAMEQAEKEGRYTEALACNQAIRLQTGELYLVNYRAGRLHFLQQDYAAASEAYRRASVLAPGALAPLQGLVNCYVAQGRHELALQTCRAVLVLDPMNEATNRRCGELHLLRKEYPEAERYYLKLLGLHPEDLEVAAQYGWCLFHQQRVLQARATFGAILLAAPNQSSALSGWYACEPKTSSHFPKE